MREQSGGQGFVGLETRGRPEGRGKSPGLSKGPGRNYHLDDDSRCWRMTCPSADTRRVFPVITGTRLRISTRWTDVLEGMTPIRRLVKSCPCTKGLKIIQDAVYNHIGSKHWTVLDPPMKDWLNQWPELYQYLLQRDQPLVDPYAAADRQKEKTLDGWFVSSMPDLNQRNPYVQEFPDPIRDMGDRGLWCGWLAGGHLVLQRQRLSQSTSTLSWKRNFPG